MTFRFLDLGQLVNSDTIYKKNKNKNQKNGTQEEECLEER